MTIIAGIELNVTPASFNEVMALKETIVKKLEENGIKIDLSSVDISSDKLSDMEVGEIGWIVEPVLKLATDSEIRKHLFKCAERAMFGKNKIDADLFEKVENRRYYYPIMMEVLKVNISPFFGLASSVFSSLPGLTDLFQKLKSQPQK